MAETDGRTSSAVEVALPLHAASAQGACAWVMDFLGDHPLDARVRFNIELVIEEVVLNIVRHAFDDPADQHFTLTASLDGPLLRLRFVDVGRPFDPTTASVRQLAGDLESAEPGGLGLPLLRRRADSMQYKRLGDANVLTVAIGLSPTARSAA